MFGLKDQDLMLVLFVVFGFFLAKMLTSKKEGMDMPDCPAYDKLISNGHCSVNSDDKDFTLTKECCEDLTNIDNQKCKNAIYQSVLTPEAIDLINNNINECKRRGDAIRQCQDRWRNCFCDGKVNGVWWGKTSQGKQDCADSEKYSEFELGGIKCTDIEYNKEVETCSEVTYTDCALDPTCPKGSTNNFNLSGKPDFSSSGCFLGFRRRGCRKDVSV